MNEHRVVFTPSGLNGTVADDTTVLDAAVQLGADLDTVCGGRGICGRCQIQPTIGEFAKWAISVDDDALTPWGALEENYQGKRPIKPGRRLGCSARIRGDVVIDIPPESQIHKQVVRKSVDVGDLVLDPIHMLRYDARLDATEVVRAGHTITTLPGFVDEIVGMAVDVGSTTLAGHLLALSTGEVLASAGRMNPQIRFGEDLMSRVSYVMMNPGGDTELTSAVRSALDEMAAELLDQAGVEAAHVLDVVLVGNPIMHHLVLGFDPTPLGQAPFPLTVDGAYATGASELGLSLPNAAVYVAPCIAGHVGADTAAAILNEGPHRSGTIQLLVDVGTNAEIVLGNDERLFACSSPTGPAFEGAQISSGQRATAGAIERVRIDPETLEPRLRVIGSERWSDELGFREDVDSTGITGICGSGIIEAVGEMVAAGVIDQAGVIRGELADRTDRVVPDGRTFDYVLRRADDLGDEVRVTQADVRAIQLAKAALKAGIDLLLEHAELDSADEIRLAGAFGAHIDPHHAILVGLIPDIDVERVRAVGNSAGSGAARLLLSGEQRAEVEAVVRDVTKIETATEPRFQEHFVTALGFPHSPVAGATGNDESGRRRRSRRTRSSA